MLSDTFWLMTILESVSLIGNQMLVNSVVGDNVKKYMFSPSTVAVFLALICITFIIKGWTEVSQKVELEDYRTSFSAYIFGGKHHMLLMFNRFCFTGWNFRQVHLCHLLFIYYNSSAVLTH